MSSSFCQVLPSSAYPSCRHPSAWLVIDILSCLVIVILSGLVIVCLSDLVIIILSGFVYRRPTRPSLVFILSDSVIVGLSGLDIVGLSGLAIVRLYCFSSSACPAHHPSKLSGLISLALSSSTGPALSSLACLAMSSMYCLAFHHRPVRHFPVRRSGLLIVGYSGLTYPH